MYYPDLSPYTYFARSEPEGLKPLNVGWLGHKCPRGETSPEFKSRLFQFCLDDTIVQLARGFHNCTFCHMSLDRWLSSAESRYGPRAHCASIGNGEIRVIGPKALYAAPALVYHYVVEHRYKPPDEFIQAVLTGPAPGSPEHLDLIARYHR